MSLAVTLLGCGGSAGVPLLGGAAGEGIWGRADPAEPRNRRTRTSCLVEGLGGARLLIDAGPDLRAQLLAARVGVVDAVLFTHSHADHVFGIDELRQVNRNAGRALPAFGTAATLAELGRRFDYAFRPATPGFFRPALVATPVRPGEPLPLAGWRARVFAQDHQVMETLGVRIGNFAYSTDVVRLPAESLALLHGLDTWVVGCFQRAPHPVHAGLAQVLDWVAALRPRRTILTHMSGDHDYGELCRTLPAGIEPGFDGMRLTIAA